MKLRYFVLQNYRWIASLSLFFLILGISQDSIFAQAWKQEKNKNGVQVFTKPVEGSPLKEFMGKTTVNASPEEILSLIRNIPSYTSWLHDCKEARMLKDGETQWFIYLRNGAPWPVSDRDVVIQANLSKSKDGKITITMKESGSPSVATPSGVVRIPSLRGAWRINPTDDGKSEVTYQAHTDPGGNIPDFAANLVVVDIPFNTLSNMKKRFP